MAVKRLMAAAIAVAALLSGCGATEPPRVTERRASDQPALRGDALLRQAMLAGHNAARAEVGQPPLAWNDDLAAAAAAAYAQVLARTGVFRHADQPMGPGHEGENLFTGTRDAYSYREMVDLWIAEKADFVNRPTPNFSRSGKWEQVAHYTQIVWHGTSAVGCALASNRTDDYLVCRYSPPET